MKTIIINLGILVTLVSLVYMGVGVADTSNEKWLCAVMSLICALNIGCKAND